MKTMQTWSGRLARAAGVMLTGIALSQGPQAFAQATPRPPERMTYQGYLAGSDGVALGNSAPKNYDVIFRIFDSESGTTPLWGEQQTVTVDKGNFSVLLGEGSATPGIPNAGITLSSLFAGATASDRYIGLTVKGVGSGGADVDIVPRVRLLSAPYAFLSAGAVKLVQTTGADLVTSSGNTVTVSGDLKANSLNATDATITGTLSPVNVRANTLVVTNITSVSTVQAGNVTAFGTLSTPDLKAGSVTVTNSFTAASLEASTSLTLGGKNVALGEVSGLRILSGNTDTHGSGITRNGVTLTRLGAGFWRMNYSQPFASAPSVQLTLHGQVPYTITTRPLNGATVTSGFYAGSTINGCEITIFSNGSPAVTVDASFDYLVVGK